MTAKINEMISRVIGVEGGYSNHPADRGGPTRWGITEQVARAFGYVGPMQTLPRVVAEGIYKQRYWVGPKLDRIGEVAPDLAAELFDAGINMGPAVAVKFLQRALNVMNRGGSDYPDITADGVIGPMTLQALKGFLAKRGNAGEKVLKRACDCLQGARYIELAEARPANEAFAYGWIANRTGDDA